MVIDFRNINGGGGSGYTLPVATSSVLGGVMVGSGLSITSAGTLSADAQPIGIATTATTGVVKIGSGITIDSAGTISVTGGTGGGIEVVSSLPASGTDGQMVLLDTVLPEMNIHITGTGNYDRTTSITATGITTKTKLFDFNHWNTLLPVYVNPDSSYTIHNTFQDEDMDYPVGEVTAYTVSDGNGHNVTFTGTVATTGCVFTYSTYTDKNNVINDIDQHLEEKQVLYTWSDHPLLTADIDYTTSNTGDWCLRYKYSELPNETLMVNKYNYGENYYHFVHNSGELRMYESASADTYTATTYQVIAKYGIENKGRCYIYWTDDEIVFVPNSGQRISFNIDGFYRTGWHKNIEHKESSKAFYKDYVWYDEDYGIIIKNNSYPMYDVEFKINPTGQYAAGNRLYSKNNGSFPTIFAPTTTGTSGYVCVAGNGWAAPTWVAPETITNGVKFWKGTQDEYDALSASTGYDSSTLYIITDNSNNAV